MDASVRAGLSLRGAVAEKCEPDSSAFYPHFKQGSAPPPLQEQVGYLGIEVVRRHVKPHAKRAPCVEGNKPFSGGLLSLDHPSPFRKHPIVRFLFLATFRFRKNTRATLENDHTLLRETERSQPL